MSNPIHIHVISELCGYDYELNYDPPPPSKKGRNRKRKVLYFNPPFSRNVKTNVGELFLKLLKTHFPKNSPEEGGQP